MDSSPFPERSMFEYIISIYLPGSLVAIMFLYVIEDNGLAKVFLDGISNNTDTDTDTGTEANKNLYLALFTYYFISTPFIFGALVDGFRHFISDLLMSSICSEAKPSFLKWNYPTRAGYAKIKHELSENIYSRQLDISYLLYHAYEFYGNFCSAILIAFVIYVLNCISIKYFNSSSIFLFFIALFTFILCIVSMRHFWKENNRLSNNWELYDTKLPEYGTELPEKPEDWTYRKKSNTILIILLVLFILLIAYFLLICLP